MLVILWHFAQQVNLDFVEAESFASAGACRSCTERQLVLYRLLGLRVDLCETEYVQICLLVGSVRLFLVRTAHSSNVLLLLNWHHGLQHH